MSALNQIQHIVVLMLENRSFDSMLGKLYPKSPDFDGLSGSEANRNAAGVAYAVHNKAGSSDATMSIPTPDPGESWTDINMQLFGTSEPQSGAKPDMSGFVKNYEAQAAHSPGVYDPGSVMHYFTPEQVPVISKLARQFAVCDRWFASAPCQTWPNRFFVHTATANGYENNSPVHFPYRMPTIYNRIDDAQLPGGWKIYFHDVPQSITLEKLSLSLSRFRLFDEFLTDAKTGDLPAYSFIEPRYFADVSLPNDQHPPHVATLGEQLIADVYNAVRNGPAWTRTLLVITYDEHGGCYDHVPPPPAQPPEPKRPEAAFNFSRYGVRVPAVIVSPYVRQGTVLRPHNDTPFDHTSIIATLRKRFPTLGPPLTERDAVAPDLSIALTLANPDNLGPDWLDTTPYSASPADVARARIAPPNGMQAALLEFAANMQNGVTGAALEASSFIGQQLQDLTQGLNGVPDGVAKDVASSITYIKSRLGALFRTV
ncbi:alkaline phosphatase family protein [Rhizobium sp. BR 315]|uniref:alkaline phosphatase family protein n=1 Tax=Rhizobium sp. BR 315 TaxID=3040014 RepID=UPI003D340478